MVKGARQREWPRHLSTHTHTHWTLPTTMSVLETPFDIHVSSVYQTHTCMQAPIPTLCISAKKTHNKGSRTRPIMSTLMPRSGIPVICSRATLSCDSSYYSLSTLVFYSTEMSIQMLANLYKCLTITTNTLPSIRKACDCLRILLRYAFLMNFRNLLQIFAKPRERQQMLTNTKACQVNTLQPL